MKTWAYLYEKEVLHGLSVCESVEIRNDESMPDENTLEVQTFLESVRLGTPLAELIIKDNVFYPKNNPDAFIKGWVECRADVDKTWRQVDGVFMSAAAFEKFKEQGPSAIPRNPRVQEFCVFNFTGMDNFFRCKIKVDIDNYTPADVRRLIVAYYDGKIDIGITSNAGAPDGVKRYYRSIERMVYTNILSLADIDKDIGGVGRYKYARSLYPVVSLVDYIAKKIPETNKVPLQDDSKLFSEYGLDPGFPIIADWSLDPAPQWNLDLSSIRDDFLWDFLTKIVDEAV
ncbi:hypothetical protein [Pseudomonas salmasensis]|uniref:hypothetical protein n=1 Tax=Pseudomonas salmasensis TaxID=2745514 RepID=UPI00164902DE|nr:hypothetical protein [Pseudomonas salmasensis]QXH77253.1 hypothetical protein HU731_022890 [Pseudomonas salmasensis]